MQKNKLAAQKAVKRDLTAISMPTKLPLKKLITSLEDMVYQSLRTGNTDDIEKLCQKQLLALLDANTEVAVLKGGRRGQLSAEKVIDEPIKEIMPVRLSLHDEGTIQAQGTADYLKRISGIDPTKTNDAFKTQNAVLIKGLAKEISDRIKKAIVQLTEQGVHIKGGKTEIANILMNAGIDPAAAPKVAETIFRTQTAAAYNAGRWNIVNDPDTSPYIWGFEYVTAHDRRVRPEHRLLEGVRLPKEDPFWQRFLPPNGWNCRCTVLEIWNDEDTAKIDFGITGVDPRTRNIKELNLLPAFDGNVGVLAGENHKMKIGQKGAIQDTRRTYKTTEPQNIETKKEQKKQEQKQIQRQEEVARTVEEIIRDTIEEHNKKTKPEQKLFTVYVEPADTDGKKFEIQDWARQTLAELEQVDKAGNKVWKVKVGRKTREFIRYADALMFAVEELANTKFKVPKENIEVRNRNVKFATDKPIPTAWKDFVTKSRETLKGIIQNAEATTPKTEKENRDNTLSIKEDNEEFRRLAWDVALNKWCSWNSEITYYPEIQEFKAILSYHDRFQNRSISVLGKEVVDKAKINGIQYFVYNSTPGNSKITKATEDIINIVMSQNIETAGGKDVIFRIDPDAFDIRVDFDNKLYSITYNRPKNSMALVRDGKVILDDKSLPNLIMRTLELFGKTQGGIKANLRSTSFRKPLETIRATEIKPYNDPLISRFENTPKEEIPQKVNSFIDNLEPLQYNPNKQVTAAQAKKDLENTGVKISGRPCDDTILIIHDYTDYMRKNGLSTSVREWGKLPESDALRGTMGDANSVTRKIRMANRTRQEVRSDATLMANKGWWTAGTEYQTYSHEDGHQFVYDIEAVLGKDRVKAELQPILDEIGAGRYPSRGNASARRFSKTINDAFDIYKQYQDRANVPQNFLADWDYIHKIVTEFSVYGSSISASGSIYQEACAEAYAEVITKGKNARPFARKIFAKIIELALECKNIQPEEK